MTDPVLVNNSNSRLENTEPLSVTNNSGNPKRTQKHSKSLQMLLFQPQMLRATSSWHQREPKSFSRQLVQRSQRACESTVDLATPTGAGALLQASSAVAGTCDSSLLSRPAAQSCLATKHNFVPSTSSAKHPDVPRAEV